MGTIGGFLGREFHDIVVKFDALRCFETAFHTIDNLKLALEEKLQVVLFPVLETLRDSFHPCQLQDFLRTIWR